jgi:hypothetical protein
LSAAKKREASRAFTLNERGESCLEQRTCLLHSAEGLGFLKQVIVEIYGCAHWSLRTASIIASSDAINDASWEQDRMQGREVTRNAIQILVRASGFSSTLLKYACDIFEDGSCCH